MLSRITVATDASEASDRMLECLDGLRRVGSREATLVHVFDVRTVGGLYERLKESLRPRLDAQRQVLEEFNAIDAERLDRMRARLEDCGAEAVYSDIAYGSPTTVILERSRAPGLSLILMGSQGRGFIHEVFMGSVANAVSRLAPLPVLFVPAVR